MRKLAASSLIAISCLLVGALASATLREVPTPPTPEVPTAGRPSNPLGTPQPVPPPTPRIVVIDADTLPASLPKPLRKPNAQRIRVVTKDGDTTEVAWDFKKRRADGKAEDVVRFGEDILIDEDQEIEGNVVSVGGNVEVRGAVHGDVVSIGGKVRVRSGGSVDGDVVSMGGQVDKLPGAHIRGSDVGLKLVPGIARFFPPRRGWTLAARGFGGLVGVGALAGLAWLLDRLARRRVQRVAGHLRDHMWSSLLVGGAVLLLSGPVCLLLLVTIIGIPLGIMVPFALLFCLASGYLIVTTLVGQRLVTEGDDGGSWLRSTLVGLLVSAGLLVVGGVLKTWGGPLHGIGSLIRLFAAAAIGLAAVTGLGAIVLTRAGGRDLPTDRPEDHPGPISDPLLPPPIRN